MPRWSVGGLLLVAVLLVSSLPTTLSDAQAESPVLRSSFRAIFALDREEGVCFLQVLQAEIEGDVEDTFGWVEVWQEGHRLMLNTTDMEVVISTGNYDTYIWASVFDERGRWIAESNLLHTGHHAGVEIVFDEGIHERKWFEGDSLELDFRLPLVAGFDSYEVDSIICIINNQTVGKMGMGQTISKENQHQFWRFVHQGQVEVGRHTLSLALLPPNWGVPSVLSEQTWFSIVPRELEILPLVHFESLMMEREALSMESDDGKQIQDCDEDGFHQCFVRAQMRIPPNRQYTEVFDAADACAAKHCAGASKGDEMLKRVMQKPLAVMLQEHFSSIVAQWQVAESFMRAARVLQCLDERILAMRAIRTVLRLVGYKSSPPIRLQCTYPGCNEMSKDACNIFSRLLIQKGPQLGAETHVTYSSFLHDIVPSHLPPPIPPTPPRYSLDDIIFGCLSTLPSYRLRADVVKKTWWPFVTKGHFYGDAPDPSLPITSYSVFEQGGLQDYQFLYDQIMEADYASSHPKVGNAAPKFVVSGTDLGYALPSSSWRSSTCTSATQASLYQRRRGTFWAATTTSWSLRTSSRSSTTSTPLPTSSSAGRSGSTSGSGLTRREGPGSYSPTAFCARCGGGCPRLRRHGASTAGSTCCATRAATSRSGFSPRTSGPRSSRSRACMACGPSTLRCTRALSRLCVPRSSAKPRSPASSVLPPPPSTTSSREPCSSSPPSSSAPTRTSTTRPAERCPLRRGSAWNFLFIEISQLEASSVCVLGSGSMFCM